jgi:hypothetical protein
METKKRVQPWARALIVALVLLLLALILATAGIGPAAAIFGFGGLAVGIVGVILALSGATRSDV